MVDRYYIDTLVDEVAADLEAPGMPQGDVRRIAREAIKDWIEIISTKAVTDAILDGEDVMRRVVRSHVRRVLS